MPKEILDKHLLNGEVIKTPLSKEVLLRRYLSSLKWKTIVLNILVYWGGVLCCDFLKNTLGHRDDFKIAAISYATAR